ncbi:helix-turn-helix transcriptional regulator [Halomicrobium sp. IBSBa]|uniref:ArsR/SmtB family transcription factor n=1 Tax=Halomicrobium sp. IBSBa TaxID=2778916 RepID=UPI001FC8F300|nr:helix-turn-helix domain-containing protein [Halomicrobium sp. IBSBa]MBO4246690.1 helix-turn-helix transcriptional regulator [Halomicrobium sp. IBSBa]
MSSLLPLEPSAAGVADRDIDPKLVDLADAEADEILSAIASRTARDILAAAYEEPRTASDIADAIESSVQNVSYHLDRLCDADLLEVVETWYSEQGREMAVYGPTSAALVLYAGAEQSTPSITTALERVLGGVAVVGVASLLVHRRWRALQPSVRAVRGESAQQSVVDAASAFATGPGGVALWTGLLVVAGLFAFWYWRTYRPARRRTA